jgi:hypothetical protein
MTDWFIEGLTARGMPRHIAEAFALNAMDESRMDPGINEAAPTVPGSRGGYGLMQWTGPRRRELEAFAAAKGVPVSDPNLQMDFLMTELQGPEASAWSKISAAGDTGSAAAAIVNSFLRPAEEHRARREADYLGGKAYAGGGNALAGMAAPQQPGQNALAMPQFADMRQDPAMFMNKNRNRLASMT